MCGSFDLEDVVIIGAGVIGCACAMRLLQAGFSVTLLEKSLPGAESSAAAAGILGAQSEVSGTGPFLELCLASRKLFPDFAREIHEISGISVGYETSGVLEVALDPGEGRLAAGRAQWMLDQGLRVELLDRAEARKLEPALTPHLIGANYYPDDHQVDPVALSRALAATVARLGGRFRGGIRVRGVQVEGKRVVAVQGDTECIPAFHVVVAGGAWSTHLAGLPPLRTTVKPMAGQIVQVETRPPLFRHVVYGYKGYIVPRPDGRILLGSTLEDRGFDKAVTVAGLQRITHMAVELVPGLGEARLLDTWSGLRPSPADGLPLLGASPIQGLYHATGHYRNGILLTPVTAEVITTLVSGGAPALDLSPFSAGAS
ncbi:MAG: glycine oxidase ThiO [Magnetococcales bacterium]|nr:glycine oxidase ThiO [Magnetococcales bacterium]MBF0321573.1 glycine oxidase ThiO [Magnetococcales bacterium]